MLQRFFGSLVEKATPARDVLWVPTRNSVIPYTSSIESAFSYFAVPAHPLVEDIHNTRKSEHLEGLATHHVRWNPRILPLWEKPASGAEGEYDGGSF